MVQSIIDQNPSLFNAMKTTEHNSVYHQEGSVWTHSLMVTAYVKALHPDNLVLQLAALLHDCGKPLAKTTDPLSGKTSFSGHEGLSTMLATDVLVSLDLTTQQKLDILRVISLHGTNVTQLRDIPYLHMFRKADQQGRLYFGEKGQHSDYPERHFITPASTSTHTVTLLVGLPCSGKSTYAKNLASGAAVLSRDDLLTYTYPDMTYNQAYTHVHSDPARLQIFNRAFDRLVTQRSREQKDLIIDMTNLSLKSRRSMMQRFPHAQFKCVVFLPPFTQIIARNATRPGKSIPFDTLISMSKSFVMPVKQEGFTDITYILE